MRNVIVGAFALATALGVTACGGSEPTADQTPAFGVAPTGAPVTIEPLDELPGSTERYEVDGVSIAVPGGMSATEKTLDGGGTQVLLQADGADRAAVILTVTEQKGATDEDVAASSLVSETQLGMGGTTSDLVRSPVMWEGMPYAVAITLTMEIAEGVTADAMLVDTRDEQGTKLVGVSAEAPAGQLIGSPAYDALRTLRVDG